MVPTHSGGQCPAAKPACMASPVRARATAAARHPPPPRPGNSRIGGRERARACSPKARPWRRSLACRSGGRRRAPPPGGARRHAPPPPAPASFTSYVCIAQRGAGAAPCPPKGAGGQARGAYSGSSGARTPSLLCTRFLNTREWRGRQPTPAAGREGMARLAAAPPRGTPRRAPPLAGAARGARRVGRRRGRAHRTLPSAAQASQGSHASRQELRWLPGGPSECLQAVATGRRAQERGRGHGGRRIFCATHCSSA